MKKLRVVSNNDVGPLPELRWIALPTGRLVQNLDEIEQALIEQRIGVFSATVSWSCRVLYRSMFATATGLRTSD